MGIGEEDTSQARKPVEPVSRTSPCFSPTYQVPTASQACSSQLHEEDTTPILGNPLVIYLAFTSNLNRSVSPVYYIATSKIDLIRCNLDPLIYPIATAPPSASMPNPQTLVL